jgi:probable F420-dependent oxidoreductase
MSPRPFRFSVSSSNAASGAAWTELARRAEGSGYSTLHVSDHYVDAASNGGQALAAFPLMAAAAAVTSTLRVGARVLCIDYHQPVVLAKTAATIDLLSDGRLELGLGAGWVASEYDAMGLAMDSAGVRLARLADTIAFLDDFFTGETLEARSGSITAQGFKGQPVPVQQPRPPIMICGGAQRVLTMAGRLADIVSFNFDNRAGVVGPQGVKSASAAGMEQRVAWVREGAGDRFDQLELEVGAYFTVVTDDALPTAEKMGGMFGLSAEEMLEHPNALIGSVDAICDRLVERRERFGISYVSVSERNLDAFAPVVERLAGR